MAYLSLDNIVSVTVSTSAPAVPRARYNVGLILGQSSVISVSDRVKVYGSLAEMATAGFTDSTPEYIAAALYFGQNPAPQKVVVGVIDTTSGSTDTPAGALADILTKNRDFYGVMLAYASVTQADHTAVALACENAGLAYFYSDSAAADITSADTDVFSVMKGLGYKHAVGLYSGTAYAAAALMGYALGANTGEPNSAYTLAYKSLTSVTPDDLTATQIGYLGEKNANYYVTRGSRYNVIENGVTASGDWFDEVIGLDQLAHDLQNACAALLATAPAKIPYTNAGAMQFVLACNEVCQDAVTAGFLAPGVWTLGDVLNLASGDMLESGYLCQAETVEAQPSANRKGRIAPPLYVCVNLAGAIHSVAIRVIVQ